MAGSFFMATFVAIFPIFSLFPRFSQKLWKKLKSFRNPLTIFQMAQYVY
jgi:hypothetical protein